MYTYALQCNHNIHWTWCINNNISVKFPTPQRKTTDQVDTANHATLNSMLLTPTIGPTSIIIYQVYYHVAGCSIHEYIMYYWVLQHSRKPSHGSWHAVRADRQTTKYCKVCSTGLKHGPVFSHHCDLLRAIVHRTIGVSVSERRNCWTFRWFWLQQPDESITTPLYYSSLNQVICTTLSAVWRSMHTAVFGVASKHQCWKEKYKLLNI